MWGGGACFCVFCAHLRMSSILDNYMKLISFLHHCTTHNRMDCRDWMDGCVGGEKGQSATKGTGGQRGPVLVQVGVCTTRHHQSERLEASFKYYVLWPIKSVMCFGFSNFKCYWMPKLILFCLYARVIYWKKRGSLQCWPVLTSQEKPPVSISIFFLKIVFGKEPNGFCQLLIIIFNRASHPVLDLVLHISRGLVPVL